jgi:phenylpropionate dioxygenase-like ring-hydroxylating dioxygenase large terminal subunit
MTSVVGRATGYLDDVAVLARVLDHLDAGTMDLGPTVGRVPVAHYLDPVRLDRELGLMRRQPVPFCPSAVVAGPGSFHARQAAGVPIVVVRDRHGQVRAFRNSCRHRGTALASGSGSATAFVCPFHGWVYALDGSLSHIPHEYGFGGIARADRGLVPVACTERAGLIWIDQDGAGSFASVATIPGLTQGQILVSRTDIPVAANWKVLTEGFLEGYHIRATHSATFLPFGYDTTTVVEHQGPHSRVSFPFRRVAALRDLPRDQWRVDGTLTVVDHVFPNAIIARLAAHTALVVVEPAGIDRSSLVTYKVAGPDAGGEVPEAVHRDIAFVETGLLEDRAMAEAVQRGLATRVGDVVFGRFESALTHLHAGLAAALDDGVG